MSHQQYSWSLKNLIYSLLLTLQTRKPQHKTFSQENHKTLYIAVTSTSYKKISKSLGFIFQRNWKTSFWGPFRYLSTQKSKEIFLKTQLDPLLFMLDDNLTPCKISNNLYKRFPVKTPDKWIDRRLFHKSRLIINFKGMTKW